nr:hypothetical protein [Planctomycetota bacterium]
MRASLLRRWIGRALLLLALCLSASAADPWERLSAAVGKPAAESEKDLEALVLENPGFHAAHYDLGTLQLERDPAKAATHLETAAAAPNRQLAADSFHNLAIARWRQGRLDEALTCAVRAAELNPELIPFRDQMRKSVLVAKDQARLKAEEEAKKLRLPTSALPPASAGLPYRATVRAAGGAGGYAYTIAGDTRLPHGMAFDADGTLHGMPEAAGTHELTIEVKDAAGASATGKFNFVITPPPEILTMQLPEAIAGLPYHATLRASGLAQARWSAVYLPEGLVIAGAADGSAVISGETSAIGTHGVEVAAEEGQRRAHRRFELVVSDSFAPDVLELPPATAWAPYHHRCGVRGPEQEYHWSLVGEAAGFTLADDGQLSGEPATAGDLPLSVDLKAADGR